MDPNEAVYFFPHDGQVLAVIGTAQHARNVIMHHRFACDDCGRKRYGIRPFYTDDREANDLPVMMALCSVCAPKMERRMEKARSKGA